MTNTQHTGVVVSTEKADAWHVDIKIIMAERQLNFGDAVNWYIAENLGNDAVDQSGWDVA